MEVEGFVNSRRTSLSGSGRPLPVKNLPQTLAGSRPAAPASGDLPAKRFESVGMDDFRWVDRSSSMKVIQGTRGGADRPEARSTRRAAPTAWQVLSAAWHGTWFPEVSRR